MFITSVVCEGRIAVRGSNPSIFVVVNKGSHVDLQCQKTLTIGIHCKSNGDIGVFNVDSQCMSIYSAITILPFCIRT